jgi:hypothetical protein
MLASEPPEPQSCVVGRKPRRRRQVRARREEDQEEEDYIFKPDDSLHFQNGADSFPQYGFKLDVNRNLRSFRAYMRPPAQAPPNLLTAALSRRQGQRPGALQSRGPWLASRL